MGESIGTTIPLVECQLKNEEGGLVGEPFSTPVNIDVAHLQKICNLLLNKEDFVPYGFYVDDVEVVDSLETALVAKRGADGVYGEHLVEIIYEPRALFRVRSVTRCTSTLEGHAEAVLSVSFSGDSRYLASGSGDCTVRFWDLTTETPQFTCKEHSNWVLCVAWSPDSHLLASGGCDNLVILWDPETGKRRGKPLKGHTGKVCSLAWKPFHLDTACRLLASASHDRTCRIWDTVRGQTLFTLGSHTHYVTCVKWGGSDLIYTASRDTTVKVWRASDGTMCRSMKHAHWVNTLALSTDHVMRTAAFDPAKASFASPEIPIGNGGDGQTEALRRYTEVVGSGSEFLVSGSEDRTLYLWRPEVDKQSLARMTGHMNAIVCVAYSPDGRCIASASFDKSVRLWDGRTGKYRATLLGHVSRVYQVAWSSDSRLLCSGSQDSTLKVWDISKEKPLLMDLPGHADEVFSVDWSADGQRVASGGRDKVLKLWRK